MSLQVWLPLNGNTKNHGLCGDTLESSGVTFADGGKIGAKYLSAGTITIPAAISGTFFNKTGMSFAFWLYPIGDSSTGIIMGQTSMAAGDNRMYSIFQYSTPNNLHLSWQDETSSNTFCSGSWSNFFPANAWTHCCITYNGSIIKIYKNGTLYTTVDAVSKRNSFNYNFPIWGNAIRKLNDVRIYDHCLSAKEVKIISQGLVLHYPLNDPYIESATNLISNGDISNTCFNATLNKYGFGSETNIYKTTGEFQGRECTKIYMGTENQTGYPYVLFSNLTAAIGETRTLSFDYFPTKLDKIVFYTYRTAGTTVWSNGANKGVGNGDTTIPVNLNRWNHISISITNTGEATDGWGYMRIGSGSHISTTTDYWLFDNVMVVNGSVEKPFTLGTREANNIIYDTSGYCNNGTASGALATSNDTSKYDCSTEFNGTTSGIIINNLALNSLINNNITYSFWIKPNGENGARSVYFGSYNATSWSIEKNTSNLLRLYWNGSPDEVCSGATIIDGIWQHICITKNGSNNVKVYINGQQKWSSTVAHNILTFPTTYRIGRDIRSGDGTPYKGLMSDFRIYATTLSAEDIAELYSVGASIDNKGNIFTYQLEEG